MKDDIISVPATVTNFQPRQDRSWKLQFETRELSSDEIKVLADSFQGEGWLLFKPNDFIEENEIPEGTAEVGGKSPSQRLYNTIFVLWKQKGGKGDFQSYYRTYMEKLIEHVKTFLET